MADAVTRPALSPVLLAAFWMTGAIASFMSMAIAGRAVSPELDTFEIMLYRSLLGFCIVLGAGWSMGALGQITTRRMGLQTIRNVAHFAGQNLWFYAITVLPLAQVFALEFTTPLWVLLLSPLILGERITRIGVITAAIGFVGILFVAQPSPETLNIGVLAAALCAVGFGLTALFTRLLTRTETIICILFWLTAFQAVFGLIMAGWDGDIALPSRGALPWIVLISLAGLLAHLCLTKALSLAPASTVMPMDFVRLPAVIIVGVIFYAEPLDPLVIFGAALILGANYINITRNAPVAVVVAAAKP